MPRCSRQKSAMAAGLTRKLPTLGDEARPFSRRWESRKKDRRISVGKMRRAADSRQAVLAQKLDHKSCG